MGNCAGKRAALYKIKDVIDTEMRKVVVYCRIVNNVFHNHSYRLPGSRPLNGCAVHTHTRDTIQVQFSHFIAGFLQLPLPYHGTTHQASPFTPSEPERRLVSQDEFFLFLTLKAT